MRSGGIFGSAITGGEKGKTEKTIRIHALDDLMIWEYLSMNVGDAYERRKVISGSG